MPNTVGLRSGGTRIKVIPCSEEAESLVGEAGKEAITTQCELSDSINKNAGCYRTQQRDE